MFLLLHMICMVLYLIWNSVYGILITKLEGPSAEWYVYHIYTDWSAFNDYVSSKTTH